MEKFGKKLDFWRQGWYNKAINIVFGAVFRFFPVSRSCSFFLFFFLHRRGRFFFNSPPPTEGGCFFPLEGI